jgi:hypothetical protein
VDRPNIVDIPIETGKIERGANRSTGPFANFVR